MIARAHEGNLEVPKAISETEVMALLRSRAPLPRANSCLHCLVTVGCEPARPRAGASFPHVLRWRPLACTTHQLPESRENKKCPMKSSENCLNSAPNPVVGRESDSAAQLSGHWPAGYALLPCCWCGEPMRRARSSKALRCTISSSKRTAPHLFLAKVRGIFLTKCPNPFNFCCSLESP